MGGLREMQGARSTGTLIECLSPLEDGTEEEREREREREKALFILKKNFKEE